MVGIFHDQIILMIYQTETIFISVVKVAYFTGRKSFSFRPLRILFSYILCLLSAERLMHSYLYLRVCEAECTFRQYSTRTKIANADSKVFATVRSRKFYTSFRPSPDRESLTRVSRRTSCRPGVPVGQRLAV